MRTFMRTPRMNPQDAERCRWIGYSFVKGVTNPERELSSWAPETAAQDTGLHGRLIQQFGGVDDDSACYDRESPLGFGGFIRWVRFSSPTTDHRVFGIDFSPHESPVIGVATSMLDVIKVAHQAHLDGIPDSDELVLLEHTMCESAESERWRREQGLITVKDWRHAWERFAPPTWHCPSCGLRTFTQSDLRFCHQCGKDPHDTWRKHGLEN